MITDGNGNVLAGGERGGKSHITYKPYGEILRTDSYGPDITKFKYSGQEEDQESGLYYYKARYYDAALGRFASNDGMTFPQNPQGMNRLMYVDGNPIKSRDKSGFRISNAWAYGIIEYLSAPEGQKERAFVFGFIKGNSIDKKEKRERNHLKVYNFLNRLSNVLLTVGSVMMAASVIPGLQGAFVPGFAVTVLGAVIKCGADSYKANNIARDPNYVQYLSYSNSFGNTQSSANNTNTLPPDTIQLIRTSEAEKTQNSAESNIGCSGSSG